MASDRISPIPTPNKCQRPPPGKHRDIRGHQFGRLTAIGFDREGKYKEAYWWFDCECGARKVIVMQSVVRGLTVSCGCIRRLDSGGLKSARGGHIVHRKRECAMYAVYQAMKNRCTNPKSRHWRWYGGRGITMCAEWLGDRSKFFSWAEANGYKSGLQIDRVDNDKGYSPENCRWTTAAINSLNKSNTRCLTHRGETLTVREWSKRTGIHQETINSRVKTGWDVADALTILPRKRRFP